MRRNRSIAARSPRRTSGPPRRAPMKPHSASAGCLGRQQLRHRSSNRSKPGVRRRTLGTKTRHPEFCQSLLCAPTGCQVGALCDYPIGTRVNTALRNSDRGPSYPSVVTFAEAKALCTEDGFATPQATTSSLPSPRAPPTSLRLSPAPPPTPPRLPAASPTAHSAPHPPPPHRM